MSQLMTIARPYAEAAFSYASEHGQIDVWAVFLDKLVGIAGNKDILRLYHSPKIHRDDLLNVIMELAQVKKGQPQANFVQLLIEKKRFTACAEIAKRYVLLQHQAQDMLDINMITAVDISEAEKTNFSQRFATLLGRKVLLQCESDKDILGGFIIRYGDKVIDSSIRGQLSKLADSLMS